VATVLIPIPSKGAEAAWSLCRVRHARRPEGSVDDHPDITASRRERQFRANGGKRLSKNGGTLERAAQVAKHASTPTTQLYDRR